MRLVDTDSPEILQRRKRERSYKLRDSERLGY
jgi:hypothetical protein